MPSLIRKFLPRTASTALAIALFTFGLMNDTHAAACPTEHFDDFAKLFEDQAETRHTYIQQPLTLQRAVVQDNQVSVISNKAQDPTREVEKVFALQKSNDLKVEVKFPDRVTLRDSNGEFLIVLLFEQKNCWELSKIEDWSLGQQLSAGNASDPAAIAVKRGNLYDRLAAETQSNSLIKQ